MFAVGIAASPEMKAATENHLQKVTEALEPWYAGRYANFTEAKTDPGTFFSDEAYARLQGVKAKTDPDGIFVAAHGIA